jgi:FKBP-type peptidyl-prolyl cis-trans isomerase FkpA
MKKIILTVIAVSLLLASCRSGGKDAAKAPAATKDPSYAFGVGIGKTIKEMGVELKYDQFLKGMKDVLEKDKPSITDEEAAQIIQTAIVDATAKKAKENLAKEEKFLADNGKKSGVVTTASGLQYQVVKEGTGANPKATDIVKVNYVGTLLDGTKFDSSIDRGEPATFPLNQVIPGWTEGIQLMKVGEKAKFFIPSKLAYGENGMGRVIPANSTLVFEVDLLEINPAAEQPAAPAKK